MDRDKLEELRSRLVVEQTSVDKQLAELGAEDPEGSPTLNINEGFADSAAATSERSEKLGLIEQLQATHRDVVKALARIEDGTYGKCERCGKEIPVERLEARPTASLCVDCQKLVGR